MAESFINQTEGSGKKSHTWNKTIGANSVEDEFVLPGEFPGASYRATGQGADVATTGNDVFQVMAGSTLVVYIRAIRIWQAGLSAAANTLALDLQRVTTAGTGGTAVTPRPFDSTAAASGATAASSVPNATKGTAGVLFGRYRIAMASAQPTNSNGPYLVYEAKTILTSLRIPAGTTNGISLRVVGGITTTPTIDWECDLVEWNF